jgi:uncharacterized membrane protein
MFFGLRMLAQSQEAFGRVLFWSIVLIIILAVLFGGLILLRRWLHQDVSAGTGFTLSDLRELHRQGKMSDEEFAKAKEQLLATLRRPPPAADGEQKLP